jgi:hypothetical protein
MLEEFFKSVQRIIFTGFDRTRRACASWTRILLSFVALILVVSPWTEWHWTFDHFLRGGHDFELGLLSFVVFLCFMLLMAERGKQTMDGLLSIRQRLSAVFRKTNTTPPVLGGGCIITAARVSRNSSASLDLYNLPLQI